MRTLRLYRDSYLAYAHEMIAEKRAAVESAGGKAGLGEQKELFSLLVAANGKDAKAGEKLADEEILADMFVFLLVGLSCSPPKVRAAC